MSVAGVAKSAWTLRFVGMHAIVLVLLWAFSPLGSQAATNSVTAVATSESTTEILQYINADMLNQTLANNLAPSGDTSGRGFSFVVSLIQAMIGTSIASPLSALQFIGQLSGSQLDAIKRAGGMEAVLESSSQDTWGNLRTPSLESLPQYQAAEPKDWVNVPTDSITGFASLIGQPIGRLAVNSSGSSNFTISDSYHNFDCSPWIQLNWTDPDSTQMHLNASEYDNTPYYDWMRENYHRLVYAQSQNVDVTTGTANTSLDREPYVAAMQQMLGGNYNYGFFVDTMQNLSNINYDPAEAKAQLWEKRQIIFGSSESGLVGQKLSITTCNVNVSYVDMDVTCKSGATAASAINCRVNAMRATPNPPFSTNFTAFEPTSIGAKVMRYFPSITANTQSLAFAPTLFEQAMANGLVAGAADDSTVVNTLGGTQGVDLSKIPIHTFNKRLGLYFNTFWSATMNPALTVGGSFASQNIDASTLTNVTATHSTFPEIRYSVNRAWMAIYFISILVMYLSIFVSVFLRLVSQGPDIFGYMSSLTRDSRYVVDDSGLSSTLTGAERARVMRERRFKLVDVKADSEIGKIAFAEVDEHGNTYGEEVVSHVKKGRLYE